jgi:hypothetical protein
VKPYSSLPAYEDVAWHLSGNVGPVPPYGAGDIPHSDTHSKLSVHQADGNSELALIGAMNGLDPNTVYTVLVSKGYFASPVFWPGLLTISIHTFTFTTDRYGSGIWHIYVRDTDFNGPGTYAVSVWINSPNSTVLISNTFMIQVR